jgi:hypothetical protein
MCEQGHAQRCACTDVGELRLMGESRTRVLTALLL